MGWWMELSIQIKQQELRKKLRIKKDSKTALRKKRRSVTMALRHVFDIPGGEGRIQNVDESMTVLYV